VCVCVCVCLFVCFVLACVECTLDSRGACMLSVFTRSKSVVENDLQIKAFYESSPLCVH